MSLSLRSLFLSLLSIFLVLPSVMAKPFYAEGVPEYADDLPKGPEGFADLAEKVRHAVVNISSENQAEEKEDEKELNPFFKQDPLRPRRSLGSGFIVSNDGYIITNNHVVQDGASIVVRVPDDKTEYKAKLIGRDPKTDIALIKVDGMNNKDILFLGDSDSLKVGEWVIAIGNQFQLGQTVTAGIVSAKSRRVPSRTSGPYDQFIQTDASINPGSSGGPLLNGKGQVVGINTAIYSPGRERFGGGSGFNIGIGFSIPINQAKEILIQLKKSGRVIRGLLGVIIQSVTPDVQEAMELAKPHGALVADVLEDTPAIEAGFKREDVIIRYNGNDVREHNDLPLMVARTPVGTTAKVVVLRKGEEVTLTPKIGELKDKPVVNEKKKDEPDRLGLIVTEITGEFSELINQPTKKGVVIGKITPGSAAEKTGFLRGDVIEQIARKEVTNLATYQQLVKNLPKDRAVLILVRRKEGTRFLTLRVK